MLTVTLRVILLLTLCVAGVAADPLAHRHAVGVAVGSWTMDAATTVETLPNSVTTSLGNDGVLGGLFYRYWLEEDLALTVDLDVRELDLRTEVGLFEVSTHQALVGSMLLGLKYYLPASTRGGNVRPHLGGKVGLYRAHQDEVVTGMTVAVTSRSASAVGGQLGAGVDFVLGAHFLTELWLGYNLVTDFSEIVGGSENASGPEFSLGLGYAFGQGE